MNRGTFCLSFDVEAHWGRSHLKDFQNFTPKIRQEKAIIKEILKLLEKHKVRATWAVVGKMFEEDSDIIELLKKSNQEIASHSLTHADFSRLSRKEAETDIFSCVEIANKKKVKLRSFVYPFNHVNHLPVLRKNHFNAFRGQADYPFANSTSFFSPNSQIPIKKDGLINIPGSMYFASNRKFGKFIPKNLRVIQAKRGINQAMKKDEVFHLWTHPIDFADSKELLFEFENILEFAADLRDKKLINIQSMDQIASKI
jgi:peptidoglycan/xylan/chitin deacetylase (PgdA/CDA1 family)